MQTAGIIVEYNPLHGGHLHLIQCLRKDLGADCGVVCAMSGCFVQRGEPALLRPHARAEAAVRSGADLVLELPLPWAVSSAERFADGGVQVLAASGVVDTLAFGSECGDAAALRRAAQGLEGEAFPRCLQEELRQGDSFAAARQRALSQLIAPEDAALLSRPNNALGIEYCRALLRQKADLAVWTMPRAGAGHDALPETAEEFPSGSALRGWLTSGERDRALAAMPPAMRELYLREEASGRAPVVWERGERMVLSQLRRLEEADFAALDQGREGLYHRFVRAAQTATSLEGFLEAVKTKRYPLARLRRMLLWAYLGLEPERFPDRVPYLRVLAANPRGCELLAKMRRSAALPVLTKPAQVRALPEAAQELFRKEVLAADLYALFYPDLSEAEGGAAWRQSPVILRSHGG